MKKIVFEEDHEDVRDFRDEEIKEDDWEKEEYIEISEDDILQCENVVEFSSISFSIFSAKEIKKISVCEIKDSKLSGEGTVYDPRMGVLKNHTLCVTCNKHNDECTGHFGHIELPIPIGHPMYTKEILMYLNEFCGECSSLLMTYNEMKLLNVLKLRGANRLKAISEYTSKVKVCPDCDCDKWCYYVEDYKYYKHKGEKSEKTEMSFLEIENVLGSIKKSDLKLMGLTEKDREITPVDFIITNLLVLPICARPFVETNRGPCDDDLTSKYIEIIKRCTSIRNHMSGVKILKEDELNEKKDGLLFHIRTLMYNYQLKSRQINGRPIKCIRERMNGKGGLFRQNLSGKRNDFTGRTVIDPDPTLRADEIMIPEEFAEKLTFPEKVYALNINIMNELVNNGKANYVKRTNTSGKVDTIDLKKNLKTRSTYEIGGFSLIEGDVVLREGKKIYPEKFKAATGRDITLLQTDKVARGGKIIKGFKLPEKVPFHVELGDTVRRNNKTINPDFILQKTGEFVIESGDRVLRGGVELKNITPSRKRVFKLQIGDIVERHLRDGDIVLYG